jgi:Tfp pilus assembly protein PilV
LRRRSEHGSTLIEVMVAAVVLLVAVIGFIGIMMYAVTANSVAHRRTNMNFLRGALVDRMAVTPRSAMGSFPASTWVIDGCFDWSSQWLASNSGYSTSFACPAGTAYQSWLNVVTNSTSSWTVHLVVERTDRGCSDDANKSRRYSSLGCSAADLLLTD